MLYEFSGTVRVCLPRLVKEVGRELRYLVCLSLRYQLLVCSTWQFAMDLSIVALISFDG